MKRIYKSHFHSYANYEGEVKGTIPLGKCFHTVIPESLNFLAF